MEPDPIQTCKRLAFRLEVLPYYADQPDGSSQEFDDFLKNGESSIDHNDSWAELVRSAVERGVRVQRLRLVESPPTPYERFELVAGYLAGREAGEEIRIAARLELEDGWDFWAYDDTEVEIPDYDKNGYFLDSEVVTIDERVREVYERASLLFGRSQSLDEYLSAPRE